MRKLFVAAMAGMVGSATFLGAGYASATDSALIVPGTAPPASGALRTFYHFDSAKTPEIGQGYYDSANATKQVVPYPGSLWPITGPDSPPLGQSVQIGANNLDSMIRSSDGSTVVTGLSQGTLALDAEQARLANDPNAPAPDQLRFVKAGDPNAMFRKYFAPGTYIPFLNYTVPYPVESQYDTTSIVAQYDIFSNPPDRPGNLLALVNAVAAGGLDHTATAFSSPADVPAQNVSTTTNSRGATTTTYFVPADELPLTTVLRDAGVPNAIADQANRIMTPMVENAYGPAPQPRQAKPLNLPPLPTQLPVVPPQLVNQIRGLLPRGAR